MSSHSVWILCLNRRLVAGPKELMKNISLSENGAIVVPAFYEFSQTALLVCFKLRERGAVVSRLCIRTLKPWHFFFFSPLIKVTLTCIVNSHSFLAPTVQAARQFHCCTINATYSVFYHWWEWDLFIYRQYSTIYLYVLFIPCHSSVHLNYIVNMQTIWNLCFMVLLCVLYMMAYLHTYFSSSPLNTCCDYFILWWCGRIKWRNMSWCSKHHLNLNAALMI